MKRINYKHRNRKNMKCAVEMCARLFIRESKQNHVHDKYHSAD